MYHVLNKLCLGFVLFCTNFTIKFYIFFEGGLGRYDHDHRFDGFIRRLPLFRTPVAFLVTLLRTWPLLSLLYVLKEEKNFVMAICLKKT